MNPRFLHPRECGLLLGLPGSEKYTQSPRACLALLGLVASPIQMVWIYAHLLNNFAKAHDHSALPSPLSWVAVLSEGASEADPTSLWLQQGIRQCLLLRDSDGSELCITSPMAITAGQLLSAQRISLGWNEAGSIGMDGQTSPLNTLFDSMGGPYLLTSHEGPSERPVPHQTYMIAIKHHQVFHVVPLNGGQFLFEALRRLDINLVNHLVNVEGKVYVRTSESGKH